MRETPVSNAERAFLLKAFAEGKRTDGRSLRERRELRLTFGSRYGCCVCTSGNGAESGGTVVSAQVSCSVAEPAATRPNEGVLKVNVQFLSTAAPRFACPASSGTASADEESEITEIARLLERLLIESRCLDTESLCIVAEEKVWCVRVDVRILNHAGNVADCASVAAVAALAHFRRPDVTLDGSVVTIHPTSERDPIPLALHHFPIASTYAFFKRLEEATSLGTKGDDLGGEKVVVATDPTHLEESIMEGKVVLGVNPYKEICTLHLAGRTKISQEFVLKLVRDAAEHAKAVVNRLKNSLAQDEAARKNGLGAGNGACLGLASMALDKDIMLQRMEAQRMVELERIISLNNDATNDGGRGSPVISVVARPENGSNNEVGAVVEMHCASSDDDDDDDVKVIEKPEKVEKQAVTVVDLEDGDSEEEVTAIVSGSTMS